MDSADELVQEGIRLAAVGRRKEALTLFKRAVEKEPCNEVAWLWLAELVEGDEERMECLEEVVDINPENRGAAERLAALKERATYVEPALSDIGSLEPEAGEAETLEPATEQSVRFCGKCGTDNPGDSRFCRGCGARLGVPVGPEIAPVAGAAAATWISGADDPGGSVSSSVTETDRGGVHVVPADHGTGEACATASGSADKGSLKINTTGIKVAVLLLVCAAAFMGYINTFEGILICLATVGLCEIIKRMK